MVQIDISKQILTITKTLATELYRSNRTNSAAHQEKANQAKQGDQTGKTIDNAAIPAEIQVAANRLFRIPVFLSHPNFQSLNILQQQFLTRLIREIQNELLFPRTLPRTEAYPESILTNIRRMMLSSYGLTAANLRLTQVRVIGSNQSGRVRPDEFWLGSPFSQIEPAMAFQYGLPQLLIFEKGIKQEGIYAFGIAPFTILTWDSETLNPIDSFFDSIQWRAILQNWSAEVRSGYYQQTEPEFGYMGQPSNPS